MYGNLFLKHNIILNWECCLTVSLLQLHGMILLYEFLKETSILSAFEREEVVTIILRYLLNGTLSSFSMFLPTFPQQIMLPWQQNSQNRHFAFSCSKSRLRNWSSSCRAHCSGEQEPWYGFCLFLLLIFLVWSRWPWKNTSILNYPWGWCLSSSVPWNLYDEAAQPWKQGSHRDADLSILIHSPSDVSSSVPPMDTFICSLCMAWPLLFPYHVCSAHWLAVSAKQTIQKCL